MGRETPEHITAAESSVAAIASRRVKRAPDSGATRITPSPSASGAISCACHALVRFSKPVPAAANTAHAQVATQPSTCERTITCHSKRTIARCTAITSAMYGQYECSPNTA